MTKIGDQKSVSKLSDQNFLKFLDTKIKETLEHFGHLNRVVTNFVSNFLILAKKLDYFRHFNRGVKLSKF